MYTLLPKLLRKDNPDDADAYKAVEDLNDALTQAEKEGIRNIALTGPYGSGKSSVLKTLMHDFKDNRHYLSISLATLQSDDDLPDAPEDKKEEKREVLNRRIEYSILQQLIYKEKSSTVPSSRFKRIAHFTKAELIQYAFWVVGFLICFFIAFEPSFARIESMYTIFDWGRVNKWIDLAALIYMLFCFGYVIRYVIQGYSNSKLNKLNLKDGEIDIKEDTSIFNKHLDEIIYFFRATRYDVVVIEDLDRFKTSDIYLKLRELNQLINESKEINRHIVFVYAVKDDVFINQDRTKFFDYIITIIPVINPSNSKNVLKKALKEINVTENEISDDDISKIAFFIHDMRILTNIVHEFKDYRDRLSKGEQQLDLTKLLAMIVYKNYHPNDFSQLHYRKGCVYNCVALKSKFIETVSKELEAKRAVLDKQYQDFDKNRDISISDLRYLFVLHLVSLSSNSHIETLRISNQYYKLRDIANSDSLFDQLLLEKALYYQYYQYNSLSKGSKNISIAEEYKTSKYRRIINRITEESRAKWENESQLLVKEIRDINAYSIRKLLSYASVRDLEDYKVLSLPELIEVFLIEGYIDENYYDYISYFYDGMISPSDRDYLTSIRRLISPRFTHHIDKIDNFFKELYPNNFESEGILNVEILDYLVQNKESSKKLSDFYLQFVSLISLNGYNIPFLSSYYKNSSDPKTFFESYLRDNLVELWYKVNDMKTEDEIVLIECLLKFGGKLSQPILDWLEDNYNYIRKHTSTIGTSRIAFINKSVRYNSLDKEDTQLVICITNCNAYKINPNNVTVVTAVAYNDSTIEDSTLSFDLIRNCPNSQIPEYLLSEDNLKLTFNSLSGSVKTESIESIDFLLQSSLNVEDKQSYLTGQLEKRDNIDGLSEEEQKILIGCNVLKPTWKNIDKAYTIFQNQEGILSTFINKNIEALSEVGSAVGIKNEAQLFDLLFGNNNTLSLDGYRSLINAFECVCEGNEYLSKINSDRFDVLLNNDCIPFDLENLGIINGTVFLSRYLIYNSSSFINHLDWDYSFSASTLLNLLKSDKFTQHEKKFILEKAGANLILASSQLASISAGIIADNLPDTNFNIAEIRAIITNSDNQEDNIRLVTYLIPSEDLNEDDISQILKSLKDEKFVQLSERHKRPKFDRIPIYENLFWALKLKHFISSISGNNEFLRPNYPKSR